MRRLADPGGTFSGEVASATALRFHWNVVPMFTALIRDVSREFDLGTRAAALVNESLRFIARTPGGLAGFIARFEAADMSLLASSWLGNSESEPMTAGELEGALGWDGLRLIGRKVGLPAETVGPALAFLIPRVIGLLTPNGVVPVDHPAEVREAARGTRTAGEFDRR